MNFDVPAQTIITTHNSALSKSVTENPPTQATNALEHRGNSELKFPQTAMSQQEVQQQKQQESQHRRARRNRSHIFFDNLQGVQCASSTELVPMFQCTPGERILNQISRNSGRQLDEIEILQRKYIAEFRQLVPIIACALNSVIAKHAGLARTLSNMAPDDRYSIYETNAVPGIYIEDYVAQLANKTCTSPSTLLAALVFLDRLTSRHPTLLLTQLNIFKLFFVAVRVASKVVDLRTLNNRNFAHVGGIQCRHLNDLEAKFLIDIRFDLYLPPREFQLYAQRITPVVSIPRPHHRSLMRPAPPGQQQQLKYAQVQQHGFSSPSSPRYEAAPHAAAGNVGSMSLSSSQVVSHPHHHVLSAVPIQYQPPAQVVGLVPAVSPTHITHHRHQMQQMQYSPVPPSGGGPQQMVMPATAIPVVVTAAGEMPVNQVPSSGHFMTIIQQPAPQQ